MKKLGAVLFVLIGLGIAAVPASADTLTLESTNSASANGSYVYPYNFAINGDTSNLTPLMCLNFNLDITFQETWNVTLHGLPTGSSQTAIDYRALALILAGAQTNAFGISDTDYQVAAWSIFDPAGIIGSGAWNSTTATVRSSALAYAVSPTLPGFNYNNFTLYTPTSDQTGWTKGEPQEFLGESNGDTPIVPHLDIVPTPEPSSLVFLGTGMIGIGSLVRRRFVRS